MTDKIVVIEGEQACYKCGLKFSAFKFGIKGDYGQVAPCIINGKNLKN